MAFIVAAAASAQVAQPVPDAAALSTLVPADAYWVEVVYYDALDAMSWTVPAQMSGVPWNWARRSRPMEFQANEHGWYADSEPAWSLLALGDDAMMWVLPPGTLALPGVQGNPHCAFEMLDGAEQIRCGRWRDALTPRWGLGEAMSGAQLEGAWGGVDVYALYIEGERAREAVGWFAALDLPLDALAVAVRSSGQARAVIRSPQPESWSHRVGAWREATRHGIDELLQGFGDEQTWRPVTDLIIDALWQPIVVSTEGEFVSLWASSPWCWNLTGSAAISAMLAYRIVVGDSVDITAFDGPWEPSAGVLGFQCTQGSTATPSLPWGALEEVAIGNGELLLLWDTRALATYVLRNGFGVFVGSVADEHLSAALERVFAMAATDGSLGGIYRFDDADETASASASSAHADLVLPRSLALALAPASQLACGDSGYCAAEAAMIRTPGTDPDPRLAVARSLVPTDAALAFVVFHDAPATREEADVTPDAHDIDLAVAWITPEGRVGGAGRVAQHARDDVSRMRDEAQQALDDILAAQLPPRPTDPTLASWYDAVRGIRVELHEGAFLGFEVQMPPDIRTELFGLDMLLVSAGRLSR